jgi:hypothetical protein
MSMKHLRKFALQAGLAVVALGTAGAAQAAVVYSVFQVPTLGSLTFNNGYGISNNG